MALEHVQGILVGWSEAKLMHALAMKLPGIRLCNAAEPEPCAVSSLQAR